MSDYPEHDKLQKIQAETQAAGEFIDWLNSQGIHLMTWREDLTDQRLTDPECTGKLDSDNLSPCDQTRHQDGDSGIAWWRRHCMHWQDQAREAVTPAESGHCCRCKKGRFYEIRNLKAWTGPDRNLEALLADWAGIDQRRIEAEKREMLKRCQEMAS